MSGPVSKRLKKKFESDADSDNDGDGAKEGKTEALSKGTETANILTILKLSPDDWCSKEALLSQYNIHEVDVEDSTEEGFVSRSTVWKGEDLTYQTDRLTPQVSIASRRYQNGSIFNCETQTYHFQQASCNMKEEIADDRIFEDKYLSCCVKDCASTSAKKDASCVYYNLPLTGSERLQWAEILDVEFLDATEDDRRLVICSRHFLPSETYAKEIVIPTKTKTRRKRTCDMLVAEEAEKVKQSMVIGRSKRTPKPNRNYDWDEVMPLIKSDSDPLKDLDLPEFKSSAARVQNETGRRRKQVLTDIKVEHETLSLDDSLMSEEDSEEYGVDISMPSLPRERPPKPKGRPNKIRDICAQTEYCGSAKPLREVKVQCNLTGEPLVTCSSCSNIDWMRLEKQLLSCISLIEGALCDAILVKCLKKILDDVTTPSHASNVLKLLAGLERDVQDTVQDIELVSGGDDFEEVEIENIIHQEEAPLTGLKVITPKVWQKVKAPRDRSSRETYSLPDDDLDSFGLQEATNKYEEEFKPSYDELEDDELEEENLEDLDDDNWNMKKEGNSGTTVAKRKRSRQKTKKELRQVASTEHQSKMNFNYCVSSGKEGIQIKDSRHAMTFANFDAKDISQKCKKSICHSCGKIFDNEHDVQMHVDQVHKNESLGLSKVSSPVTYQCNDCDEKFSRKISLNVHRMFKHGESRRYQCNQCDYEGQRLYHLKRHLKVHSDECQYFCTVCGKGLKSKQAYNNHMALHTNDGRYKCKICDKTFNHKLVYEDHERSHGTDRNYKCQYCSNTFKTHKHLTCHIRAVHLNDKRFICDICGKRHMTGMNLRTHIKTHKESASLPRSYHCFLCNSSFRGSKGLTMHMKVMHKIEESCKDSTIAITTPHPTRRPIKIDNSKFQDPDSQISELP